MIQDHAFTFGWTLLHFLWQGTALALLVWIVLGLSRRARPEMRYALAGGGLVLMALAPMVTYGILRQTEPIAATAGESSTLPISPAFQTNSFNNFTKSRAIARAVAGSPSMRARLDLLAPWLVLVWSLGVLILAGRMVGGASWLIRARRRSSPEEGPWTERLEILRCHMGVARTVILRVLNDLDGPVVVGWIRPVILIPASILTGLPATQVELLLAHELAHVARHDYAANLLQRLVETMLFFHPAVWWLGRRVRQERERCCDAVAADLLGDPCGMAEALTSLEDMRLEGPWPAFALGATGGFLGERVRVLLNLEEHPDRLRIAVASGLVVLCALSGLGLWQLRGHRLGRPWGPSQGRLWNLGRIQIRQDDGETILEFDVKNATAAEVLEAFGKLSDRQASSGNPNHQEYIQAIPVPVGQPSPERYTVQWNSLSRPQFLEYWYRLKARPILDSPSDIIVVRRDNLALPWDRAEQPPLDIWVPKHADEFSLEAARLVREAILELESKAPTPGLSQEARRKVPEPIMASLKSPDPGSPLLRCGDSWRLEQYAKRAQEEPFEPMPELRYTLNTLAILDLPSPSASEHKLVQSKQEALEKHDALNKWTHLRLQGGVRKNNRQLTPQEKRNNARRLANALSPQEQKEYALWQDQHAKLLAECQRAEDALGASQAEKGFQMALQRVKQRLAKLPAEPSKAMPKNARIHLSISMEGEEGKAWLKAGGLSVDPGLLRQSPSAEAEVLRAVEAALQSRLDKVRTEHVNPGRSANKGRSISTLTEGKSN